MANVRKNLQKKYDRPIISAQNNKETFAEQSSISSAVGNRSRIVVYICRCTRRCIKLAFRDVIILIKIKSYG